MSRKYSIDIPAENPIEATVTIRGSEEDIDTLMKHFNCLMRRYRKAKVQGNVTEFKAPCKGCGDAQ